MYGSIAILASFLVIPVNINLRGFFYIYINVQCQLMSCNGVQIKQNGEIHSCYTRDGIVHIRKTKHLKALEVYCVDFLCDAFPEFEFLEDDGSKLSHDASPNVSV